MKAPPPPPPPRPLGGGTPSPLLLLLLLCQKEHTPTPTSSGKKPTLWNSWRTLGVAIWVGSASATIPTVTMRRTLPRPRGVWHHTRPPRQHTARTMRMGCPEEWKYTPCLACQQDHPACPLLPHIPKGPLPQGKSPTHRKWACLSTSIRAHKWKHWVLRTSRKSRPILQIQDRTTPQIRDRTTPPQSRARPLVRSEAWFSMQ